MRIVKLENLRSTFNRDTGKPITEEVTDFVCESCRHLVSQSDIFCWQCGKELEQSELVEHYQKGKRLTEEEFNERKS